MSLSVLYGHPGSKYDFNHRDAGYTAFAGTAVFKRVVGSIGKDKIQNKSVIQDISVLFSLIIIMLMLFNTYVFQVGLVPILMERFRAPLMLSALYLTLSIILHSWMMNLRWLNTNRFIWTDGLQVLFVFQRIASVLYFYFYKRTSEYLGDPRLYEDSPWLRDIIAQARQ